MPPPLLSLEGEGGSVGIGTRTFSRFVRETPLPTTNPTMKELVSMFRTKSRGGGSAPLPSPPNQFLRRYKSIMMIKAKVPEFIEDVGLGPAPIIVDVEPVAGNVQPIITDMEPIIAYVAPFRDLTDYSKEPAYSGDLSGLWNLSIDKKDWPPGWKEDVKGYKKVDKRIPWPTPEMIAKDAPRLRRKNERIQRKREIKFWRYGEPSRLSKNPPFV